MTNKSTKRALISSVLALVLCFTMLLGTTFAWFTDSATSKGNIIKTGTLDVELMAWNGTSYEAVNGAVIDSDNWEPGATEVVYLAIANKGSLDLKYKVALDVYGISKNLHEVMEYAITPDATPSAPVDEWTNGIAVNPGRNATEANGVTLPAGQTNYFALSVHMDENAGNAYEEAQIKFDITVLAAQTADDAIYGDIAVIPDTELTVNGTAGEEVTVENTDKTFTVTTTVGTNGTVKATITPTTEVSNTVTNLIANDDALTSVSYDIKVEGQAVVGTDANGNDVKANVNVTLFIGTGLQGVQVYHNGTLIDSTYNPFDGTVSFTTNSFSPFEVVYKSATLAKVTQTNLTETLTASLGINNKYNTDEYTLDVSYLFEMLQTAEEAANSEYAKYHADFVVKADKDVKAGAIALLGYYESYCKDFNNDNWVALIPDADIEAGEEIRLVNLLLQSTNGSINYEELGEWVRAFHCGATMLDDSAAGTTITVELRLYETEPYEVNNTANTETGKYYTVCTYTYTFN